MRREVEAGLQRQEAVVVPILLDGALAPTDAELPESIRGLASLHAFAIIGGKLAADIDKLIRSVERGRRRAATSASASPASVAHGK